MLQQILFSDLKIHHSVMSRTEIHIKKGHMYYRLGFIEQWRP